MTLAQLLGDVPDRLERAGIPYMLTGSIASSFHGEPRATRDVDIVIDPTPESLDRFLAALPSEQWYVSREAAREALARRTQFNVIEVATGWKVDFVVRKDRAFSREELARREQADILGTPVWVASAEDTIIAKLEWAKAGEPERQLRDVAGILAVSGGSIDRRYLERWIKDLGLGDVWSQATDSPGHAAGA